MDDFNFKSVCHTDYYTYDCYKLKDLEPSLDRGRKLTIDDFEVKLINGSVPFFKKGEELFIFRRLMDASKRYIYQIRRNVDEELSLQSLWPEDFRKHFYTPEEMRDLNLNKILN